MNTEIDRKIAVIFVADVVGYSKHMEKDENATIRSYNACEKILNKLLKKYKGSVFNTAGDSVLAEFPSAVNAVECGVDFQNEIKKRNQSDKVDVKLEFRLGINMGDVVKKDNNLIGDGVNIAARLEALAQPNGISISKSVYDFVVPKTKMTFNDLGVQKVKQNEFHAFDILLDPSQKRTLKTKPKSKIPIIGAVAAAALVVIILSLNSFYSTSKNADFSKVEQQNKSSLPVLLVYPFNNLSQNDGSNLAVVFTESMVAGLAKFKGVKILSSSTSLHAKKSNYSDDEIKSNYEADYIVRGSIQSFGDKSRMTIEMTGLEEKKVVWTDSVDFSRNDVFKVQDNIASNILNHLQLNVTVGSYTKSWAEELGSLELFTAALNAREEWRKATRESHNKYIELYKPIEEHFGKDSKEILNWHGWEIWQRLLQGWSTDIENDVKKLEVIVDRTLKENADIDAYHFASLAELFFLSQDCGIAKSYAEKSVNDGGHVDAFTSAGMVFDGCGEFAQAVSYFKDALSLAPNDNNFVISNLLTKTYYSKGSCPEIISLIEPNLNNKDLRSPMIGFYSHCLLKEGRNKEAKTFFSLAKDKGLSKQVISATLRDPVLIENFLKGTSVLGSLE